MKKILILSALFMPTIINAQALESPADFEAQPEDLVMAKYNKQTETFEKILTELKTGEIFAGRLTEVSFRGQAYVIDRTGEEVKQKVTRPSMLGTLLNDLSAKSEGKLRIKVTQEKFNKDGVIESRDVWEIDAGGSWQAQTGMEDATGKSHR